MYNESNGYSLYLPSFSFPLSEGENTIYIDCENWWVLYQEYNPAESYECMGVDTTIQIIYTTEQDTSLILEWSSWDTSFGELSIYSSSDSTTTTTNNNNNNNPIFSSEENMQLFYIFELWFFLILIILIFLKKFIKSLY